MTDMPNLFGNLERFPKGVSIIQEKQKSKEQKEEEN